MKGFSGFPNGKLRVTPVPNLFFSDLLPHIDTVAELKVTLYCFWALSQQDRPRPYLKLTDFMQDIILMEGLGSGNNAALEHLLDGLERAVARGTLLHISIESADGSTDIYFINTPKGRAALEGIMHGDWRPALGREDVPVSLRVERPNIFVLYEQNIGSLTPLLADELKDAEQTYTLPWIEEAIQLAVQNNKRNWRYARAILERWRIQGKDSGNNRGTIPTQRNETVRKYDDIIER